MVVSTRWYVLGNVLTLVKPSAIMSRSFTAPRFTLKPSGTDCSAHAENFWRQLDKGRRPDLLRP